MRALPGIVGAAAVVAIGGAVAGAAIDTTPRQVHAPPPLPDRGPIAFEDKHRPLPAADHYPLKANGETYEVSELRERGLYSQKRFASRFAYQNDSAGRDEFDFDAAQTEALQWEAEQRRAIAERRGYPRQSATRVARHRPLERDRSTATTRSAHGEAITYVSRPVVQETSGMDPR